MYNLTPVLSWCSGKQAMFEINKESVLCKIWRPMMLTSIYWGQQVESNRTPQNPI